jgi:hypothetical protein
VRVTPPDLVLWLTGYVRDLAAIEGVDADISNKEPPELALPMDRPLIILRDDSGNRTGPTTFDRSIGASVLAGSRLDDQPASDLARWLAGVLFDMDLPLVDGTPIASVEPEGCNGPYSVKEEMDVTRCYLTAQYVVTGSW